MIGNNNPARVDERRNIDVIHGIFMNTGQRRAQVKNQECDINESDQPLSISDFYFDLYRRFQNS